MIKIYYSPSCSSCRKVKKWFDDQKIPYEQKDIFGKELSKDDLMEIISKSEDGTDDIISPRSKIVSENHIDFDDMTVSQLIEFIRKNPSVLRRPIIVDDHRVQVGYNAEEIRTFIPRARRIAEMACSAGECPNFGTCDPSLDIQGKLPIKK
ncbi:MAG: Spx/MgsR family RNA polymerase-binding regulatory protein [Bacilli bacterium]|nr:Spx/MgsR family RNA polymerase-binding regulatory protein [Bacilli bacterium]MCH4210930.1 Spx/MgsR family RNA polymerase-binding regulatory protein [Bacilli bacterium]MCI2055469.1 Spx/MgsR family RNA polymerase-binding regulatory protein [Bacilli bacterium]